VDSGGNGDTEWREKGRWLEGGWGKAGAGTGSLKRKNGPGISDPWMREPYLTPVSTVAASRSGRSGDRDEVVFASEPLHRKVISIHQPRVDPGKLLGGKVPHPIAGSNANVQQVLVRLYQ